MNIILDARAWRPHAQSHEASLASLLDCVLTLVYSLLFTFGFSTAADAYVTLGLRAQAKPYFATVEVNTSTGIISDSEIIYRSPPPPPIVYAGAVLATATICMQIGLAVRFYKFVRAYRWATRTGEWVMPQVLPPTG